MWQDFLREQAKNHDLSPEETDTLLKRFPEKERYIKTEAQFTEIFNEGISDVKHKIGVDTVTKRMQEIYKKFQADCPQLQQSSRGKLGILRQWLIEQFIIIDSPKTLKRCILGLKGNYQKAQEKLTEITQTLQNLLNDKTLSISKVEEGSIILIVESSQTGYEQLKRLIGREIAGFPVEYAIDEWQDVCRRMLLKQKYLTINEIIGQVYGNRNRNLIDEDLFVDLALVKPKRSENPKHPQDIEPEKGSDLYNREKEEVEKRFAYREFLQEVIRNRTEKNIAIIGEPGAGKTTLLQKLAFWLLQETDDLVVWVSLAELGSQPLGEYLEQKWLTEALRQSREEIKADWGNKFEGGAVWLLLDGLDEMSQTDLQGLNFRGWVMNAPIIVTCRLNLWQANPSQLQGFQTYLTQPFQDEQMQEFIRSWFPGLSGEKQKGKFDRLSCLNNPSASGTSPCQGEDGWGSDDQSELAESLWSELQESGKERIKDLCRNPLRLTLLCATWKVDNALPDITAALYAEFVEWIYKHKQKAFPVTEEEKEQLNAALGELAKASLEAETSRFRLTHRLVCEHLGKPKAAGSLFPLALRLGWLNEVGVAAENPREKVYGFYHTTFQEYFAALAVEDWDYFLPKDHVDKPVDPPLIPPYQGGKREAPLIKGGWGDRYRIFAPQWKQVILLWLGREDIGDEEKEGFIRALVEFKDGVEDFYVNQAFFLAAAGINEFKACSLAVEIVRQVVKWGFGEFDIQKQKWTTFIDPIKEGARKAIPETIRPLAISALIAIIENCPEEDSRRQAALSLGEIGQGNPQAIAALVNVIGTAKNEWIRRQGAENLGKIGQGNSDAIAGLLQLIRTTEDERTRWQAAESLGKIDPGNPDAIAGLVEIIRTTEDEYTRRQAVWSLGEIGVGNPDAIAGLLQLIRTTEDEWTRRLAAESLGKIDPGNPDAIAGLLQLIRTTDDEQTRRQAAESLGTIDPGNPDAIAGLLQLIRTTDDEQTRRLAAESLGTIDPGNPDAMARLVQIIRTTTDLWTCYLAPESLGEIGQGNADAMAGLVEIIRKTENGFTLGQATESLQKILTTRQHYAEVVFTLKDNLSDEVYQSHFEQFKASYKVIWNCAENLPYPEFYQAWHCPPTTPHPEVTEQTPHSGEPSFASSFTCESLQHLPIYCLNAHPLANETREREIALTLSELIWDITCPDEDPPEPATPAELRRHLKTLKRRNLLPHRAILFGSETVSTPTQPTPELMAFCQKLTGVIAVAFLTEEPLEAPLKGFPPNQPNLISAIETWLEEI